MRKTKIYVNVFLLFTFITWVMFKWFRLGMFAYTLDDFTNNIEGTYSWMVGRPVTWGNGFGPMILAHNVFLMPILGPITYFGGAKGLLVFFCFTFLITWIKYFQVFGFENKNYLILFIYIFFSATTMWIMDHPSVGWVLELLYLPFASLLTLYLIKKEYKWATFYFLLLSLVREEGMILAFAIFMTYYLMINNLYKLKDILSNKKVLIFTGIFICIFLVFFLLLQHRAKESSFFLKSSSNIYEYIFTQSFILYNLKLIGQSILMLSPFLFILFLSTQQSPQKVFFFLLILLGFIAITFIQGATYFHKSYIREHVSLTWAPRFALPFSYLISILLLFIFQSKTIENLLQRRKMRYVLCLIFFLNFVLLYSIRRDVGYDKIVKSIIYQQPQVDLPKFLSENDIKQIRELEKQLPARSNVYSFDYLIPIFIDHFIVWPYGKEYKKADIAFLPYDNRFSDLKSRLPIVMESGYEKVGQIGEYEIYASPKYSKIVQEFFKNNKSTL